MNNNVRQVSLMGCPCFAVSEKTLEQQIMYFVENKIQGYSVAINAEKILKYKKYKELKSVIDNSVYPYPDGAGAVLSIKWLHNLSSEKINMPIRVLEIANDNRLSVFIIGAQAEVHTQAVSIIKGRYPNLNLVGHMHGYNEESDIIDFVVQKKPQLILIAMGSPRQEFFAHKLIGITQVGFAIGCGGALDILAGRLKRAPEFYINNNLEWLYRLLQEPWRWKRQLFLPIFIFKLILLKLKIKN